LLCFWMIRFRGVYAHNVVQISRESGEAWLWVTGGVFHIEAVPRNTGLSVLIGCAGFLNFPLSSSVVYRIGACSFEDRMMLGEIIAAGV